MKTFRSIVLIWAAASLFAPAVTADIISATMKFSNAYEMLVQADRARDQGENNKALMLYKVALSTYTQLAGEDPDFQPRMVQFRMEHCDSQLAALLDNLRSADPTVPPNGVTPSTIVEETLALDASTFKADPAAIRELWVNARRQLEDGEPEAARELLLKGFKIDPDNADLRLLAGLAQCQARKFSDAIFLLRELADEQPSNAPVRIGLAAAYFGDGQIEAAKKELEIAIVQDPNLKEAHYNMAQLLLATPSPDLEAAKQHYQRARELGTAPDPRVESVFSEQ